MLRGCLAGYTRATGSSSMQGAVYNATTISASRPLQMLLSAGFAIWFFALVSWQPPICNPLLGPSAAAGHLLLALMGDLFRLAPTVDQRQRGRPAGCQPNSLACRYLSGPGLLQTLQEALHAPGLQPRPGDLAKLKLLGNLLALHGARVGDARQLRPEAVLMSPAMALTLCKKLTLQGLRECHAQGFVVCALGHLP